MLACRHAADHDARLAHRDGPIWHGYLAGVRAGQRYGYRIYGTWAPEYGSRAAPETVAYLKSDLENIMRTNMGKILSSKIGAIPNSNIYTDQTVAGSMGPQGGVNM